MSSMLGTLNVAPAECTPLSSPQPASFLCTLLSSARPDATHALELGNMYVFRDLVLDELHGILPTIKHPSRDQHTDGGRWLHSVGLSDDSDVALRAGPQLLRPFYGAALAIPNARSHQCTQCPSVPPARRPARQGQTAAAVLVVAVLHAHPILLRRA